MGLQMRPHNLDRAPRHFFLALFDKPGRLLPGQLQQFPISQQIRHATFFPKVGQGRKYALNMASTPLEEIADFDCAVIVTDHTQYDYPSIVAQAKLVVDTRNATRGIEAANIVRC